MLKALAAKTKKSIGMEFDGTHAALAPQSGEVIMLEKAEEGAFATLSGCADDNDLVS